MQDPMVDSPPTRIYLDGGQHVRASETLGELSGLVGDKGMEGWLPVTDPGDDRAKLIRSDRILWMEQEPEDD